MPTRKSYGRRGRKPVTPKIYLINLARSPDRLGFMERQLKAMGLAFERIEAVDGKDLTPDRIHELAVPERVEEWPNLLTSSAIGCSLSHVKAYRKFLEDGGSAAIFMEDDIELLEGFGAVAEGVADVLTPKACALLYFHGAEKAFVREDAIELNGDRRLHQALTPWGAYTTGAYILSRESARSIAEFNSPVYTTADSWGVYCRDGILDGLWAVLPPVTAPANFSSDIIYSRKGMIAREFERKTGLQLPAWLRRLAGSELKLRYKIVDEAAQRA